MNTLMSALQDALGPEHVLTATETCAAFARDALRPHRGFAEMLTLEQPPVAVVQPGSTEEVVRLVTLARQHRTPLVPYGGGSGLMGGALSVRPGIVVDLKRLDRLLEIDNQALTAQVQSGARLRPLDRSLWSRTRQPRAAPNPSTASDRRTPAPCPGRARQPVVPSVQFEHPGILRRVDAPAGSGWWRGRTGRKRRDRRRSPGSPRPRSPRSRRGWSGARW